MLTVICTYYVEVLISQTKNANTAPAIPKLLKVLTLYTRNKENAWPEPTDKITGDSVC